MHAVAVSHLTKEYRLGAMQSLRQTAANLGARLTGRKVAQPPLFKALDDVSFTVEPGEVLGIIGHNGAGKSTLLKMLSRISTPTSGSVKVNGRIAPLIEVGAGFVGDFTGRENVFLNGAILGMSKGEIARKFEEIVEFAEMADFIDTPVKRYSSGMQVKLAFAVATSIESEILIVDEVLAVGDLAFQRKCFDRMEYLIKREQRTVILVSHNIRQVERLCTRVVMMDHGKAVQDGLPRAVCAAFYAQSDQKTALNAKKHKESGQIQSSGEIQFESLRLIDENGQTMAAVQHDCPCVLELTYLVRTPIKNVIFGIGIHTTDFVYLADRDSEDDERVVPAVDVGPFVVRCRIERFPLLPGTYSFRVGVAVGEVYRIAYYEEGVFPFQVISRRTQRLQSFVPLHIEWEFETPGQQADMACTP